MLSQDQKSTEGSMEEQKQDQRQSWVGDFFREGRLRSIILFNLHQGSRGLQNNGSL